MEGSGQLHALAALPTGKNVGVYRTGGWVDVRVGLDFLGNRPLSPAGIRTTDRQAHS